MSSKENRPTNQQQHGGIMRKQLLRNVTSDPSKRVKVINHNIGRVGITDGIENRGILTDFMHNRRVGEKYAAPELQSTLLVAKKLEHLQLTQKKPLQSLNELTPRTKAAVSENVLKKLNFPNDRNLYKHLIPINVNDSVLEVKPRYRTQKKKSTSANPEPQLVDYLRPMKPLEHRIELAEDDFKMDSLRGPDTTNFRNTYEFYERHLCPTKPFNIILPRAKISSK